MATLARSGFKKINWKEGIGTANDMTFQFNTMQEQYDTFTYLEHNKSSSSLKSYPSISWLKRQSQDQCLYPTHVKYVLQSWQKHWHATINPHRLKEAAASSFQLFCGY